MTSYELEIAKPGDAEAFWRTNDRDWRSELWGFRVVWHEQRHDVLARADGGVIGALSLGFIGNAAYDGLDGWFYGGGLHLLRLQADSLEPSPMDSYSGETVILRVCFWPTPLATVLVPVLPKNQPRYSAFGAKLLPPPSV